MKSLMGVLTAAIAIALMEGPALWRQWDVRGLVCFSLLLTGLALGVAEALQWTIPNPLDAVAFLFKPASDVLERFLR